MTLSIDTNNDFVRVTKGEYGNGCGYSQFISQSSLNSSTNPQYLYQDCIRVRVLSQQLNQHLSTLSVTVTKSLFVPIESHSSCSVSVSSQLRSSIMVPERPLEAVVVLTFHDA